MTPFALASAGEHVERGALVVIVAGFAKEHQFNVRMPRTASRQRGAVSARASGGDSTHVIIEDSRFAN